MEWQLFNEYLKANLKQLPAVALMGIIIVVLWGAWSQERKERKKENQEFVRYLKSLVRPDDGSSG